ncbi:MAG: hypothetical protein HY937_01140 [Nitrosomonadales bacterium]|nr:hypothetical protein [Nitrosomonadales bacterium]
MFQPGKHCGWGVQCILRGLLLFLPFAAGAAEYSLNIADISAPEFSARGIRLVLPADGSADFRFAHLRLHQYTFRDVHIRCAGFTLSTARIACRNGKLDAVPGATLEFSYGFAARQVQFAFNAANDEMWRLDGRFGDRGWQAAVKLRNAQSKRLTDFLLPRMRVSDLPLPTQGKLDGTLRVSGNASGAVAFDVDVRLADIGFSDASGLHAAERLRGSIRLDAARKEGLWRWQGNLAWRSGEVFWQPLYLKGGHALDAAGNFDGARLHVEQARVDLPDIGRVQFSALWDVNNSELLEGASRGNHLALGEIFAGYAKPFLVGGALAESTLYGHADVEWQYRNGATQSLRFTLRDAGIADASRRFALLGVNSQVDWQADTSRTADIAFAGGALLGVPLGAGRWTVQMRGMEFSVPQAVLPVLDGKLELHDFRLYRAANPVVQTDKPCSDCPQRGAWRWQFSASLGRISMAQFSQAAGWPIMLGTLAGRIPRGSYDGDKIRADGALMFNVFDGTVVATRLELADAFGRAPRLSGNLAMRELDLDLLTRTFSFGNMQGRIDAEVNNMQLQDWQPVSFDARVFSSAGNYPKKISQNAVQNLTALGGAGAGAAIQRSYLRFFENFGYERIGWRCVLHDGVCLMSGLEGGSEMAYPIIKGAGIPAINVIGYNRAVSWGELTTRLKRVIQSNAQPIVK